MIRFALIVASTLGFFLTAALGNLMVPLLRELERMSREGFDPDAFRRLKKSALGRRMRDLDSFESICYRICAYYFDGVDYFRFPEAYASVQPEDVQSFLTDVLRPENAAMAVVAPKEGS